MFDFEKLSRFGEEARAQIKDDTIKEKPMAGIYMFVYKDLIAQNLHKKFALEFHTEDVLEKLMETRGVAGK